MNFFIYARKSSEEDDRQAMSIKDQIAELTGIAQMKKLRIVSIFEEAQSARKPGRPIFNEMLGRISKGEANGVLCLKLDRLARNPIDGGAISWLLQEGTLACIQTPGRTYFPHDNVLMMQLEFGVANQYVRDLSERVKMAVRHKAQRGEWHSRAPFGYISNPRTTNIEPHPTNSKIVIRAYEEYATGKHTLLSLSLFLYDLGISSAAGKPFVRASVARMLSNQVYLGLGELHGEKYEGSFQPIVPRELFDRVQAVLKRNAKPRKSKERLSFPFMGMMTCGECGGAITAQFARGKSGGLYRYYRCTKKLGRCSQSYVQEKHLAQQMRDQIAEISIGDDWKREMLREVRGWDTNALHSDRAARNSAQVEISAVQEKLDRLVSAFIDGDIPRESYLPKKEELLKRKIALVAQTSRIAEEGDKVWLEPLREWIEAANTASNVASSSDLEEIKDFVQKHGSNPVLLDKKLVISFSEPWASVALHKAQTRVAAQRRGTEISPISGENLNWRP